MPKRPTCWTEHQVQADPSSCGPLGLLPCHTANGQVIRYSRDVRSLMLNYVDFLSIHPRVTPVIHRSYGNRFLSLQPAHADNGVAFTLLLSHIPYLYRTKTQSVMWTVQMTWNPLMTFYRSIVNNKPTSATKVSFLSWLVGWLNVERHT